jgi:hypothetical protein
VHDVLKVKREKFPEPVQWSELVCPSAGDGCNQLIDDVVLFFPGYADPHG